MSNVVCGRKCNLLCVLSQVKWWGGEGGGRYYSAWLTVESWESLCALSERFSWTQLFTVVTEKKICIANVCWFVFVDLVAVRWTALLVFSLKFNRKVCTISELSCTDSSCLSYFLSFAWNGLLCISLIYSLISNPSSNGCSSFSFKLSPLPRVDQLVGRAVGKDPVNSLSVEGFVQKTVVTSPEVAHLSFSSSFMIQFIIHTICGLVKCTAYHSQIKLLNTVQWIPKCKYMFTKSPCTTCTQSCSLFCDLNDCVDFIICRSCAWHV